MFEDKERNAVVAATYPNEDYSKMHFNRSIQECLTIKRVVEMSSSTVDQFSVIFSELSSALTNLDSSG